MRQLLYYYVLLLLFASNGALAQEKGTFKNLGPQLHSATLQGSAFIKAKGGKEYVYTVVRGRPAHLVGYNLATNELVADLPLENTDGSWAIVASSDGTLYVSSAQGYLFRHQPGTQSLENLGIVLEGEKLVWDVVAGKNGAIYGGTYPGCRIFRYHPKDGFEDISKGPVVENQQYAQFLAYDDNTHKLYVAVYVGANVVEIDLSTGAKRELLPEHYQRNGSIYNLKLVQTRTGTQLLVWLNNKGVGRETLVIDTQTGVLMGKMGSMEVRTLLQEDKGSTIFYTVDSDLFRGNLKEALSVAPKQLLSFEGKAKAARWRNKQEVELFTSAGELIRHNTKTGKTSTISLQVPKQPIDIQSICYGPDKRVWLSGYLAGGNAAYTPATGETVEYTGLIQSEGMASQGKDLYFGVYPHAQLYRYDTRTPWNISKANPKLIQQVEGQSRPFAILSVDTLQKVYFGTVPNYGVLGGAITEYNTATEETVTYTNIVNKQSPVCLAYANGMVWGGTSISGGLGISPSAKEGKLFCWDPVKRETVFETSPIAGIMAVTALVKGPDGNLWGMADGNLFVFDPVQRKVLRKRKVYEVPPKRTHLWRDAFLVAHPSGKVYGTGGRKVFAIDPDTLNVEILREGLDLLTMDDEGVLYFRQGADLWSYTP
ncbi:hypothetical protein POKO110462_14890 [Pontibacter korlensis]|uniref:Transcriptional regulator n=1 Tax=Pontibacter korlensis TaxID=400092 RepID=A0A0E3ZJ24_9BACT|nr:hypothetical protein [Pontibacter korlensis]AKD05378.1 hypothetical protein PKOR_22945 [Pontibacter korlensis]